MGCWAGWEASLGHHFRRDMTSGEVAHLAAAGLSVAGGCSARDQGARMPGLRAAACWHAAHTPCSRVPARRLTPSSRPTPAALWAS